MEKTEQRKAFEALLAEILPRLNAIDEATPWTPSEPSWWLAMSRLRNEVYRAQNTCSAAGPTTTPA